MSTETDDQGRTFHVDDETGGRKEVKLARFSLIPPGFILRLAEHFGKGAVKYDDHNWLLGYKWSASMDSLERHFTQWKMGEDFDEETGSHHLIAVAWHACVLWVFATRHPDKDDRFPVAK